MSTTMRHRYAPTLTAETSFDEQLYAALRQSPWWMISIAVHVLVLVIAGLLTTRDAQAETPPAASVSVSAQEDVEPEVPDVPEDTDVVPTDEPPVPVPVIDEPEVVDVNPETDVDLPHEEPFGQSDGASLSDVNDVPSNSDVIGLGPGGTRGFSGRGGDRNAGQQGSGGPASDRAVDAALRWLAAHQSPDGSWEAAGFHRWCDGKPQDMDATQAGLGKALYDPGVTGLALCAFLGAGYTHRGQHPFARTVSQGLRYLKNVQDAEGCFGPRTSQHFIYNHATAALAMVEAYGMTGSVVFRPSAQKALDFLAIARNPYYAWRYGVKPGDNDSSVTGWMMMALKSAKMIVDDAVASGRPAPLLVDEEAFDGIRAWIDQMTDPVTGRVGYIQRGSPPARPQHLIDRFPPDQSESLTGVGVLARVFLGEDPRTSDDVQKGARLCAELPPLWQPGSGRIDMYYWYYATLALYQVGGSTWRTWSEAMEPAIIDSQRQDGDVCRYKGSWDPIGPWGEDGGRVYSTALMAMCLQIHYRYPRVFGTR